MRPRLAMDVGQLGLRLLERTGGWLRSYAIAPLLRAASQAEAPEASRVGWRKPLLRVFGMLLVGLCAYYLGRTALTSMRQFHWRIEQWALAPILAALGLATLSVGLGGWAWQLLLAGLGYPRRVRDCLAIQVNSNLAKYLPGYGWQVAGKAYLTARLGIPASVAATAVSFELATLLSTGLMVALVCMPGDMALPFVGAPPPWIRNACALLVLVGLALSPRAIGAALDFVHARSGLPPTRVRASAVWCAQAVILVAWGLLGLTLICLLRALYPFPWQDWVLAFFSMAASFLVSLLALFVPGGIGVREGVMTYLLGERLPGSVAVAASLLSRLVLILGEVLAFCWVWAWQTIRRRNQSITLKD